MIKKLMLLLILFSSLAFSQTWNLTASPQGLLGTTTGAGQPLTNVVLLNGTTKWAITANVSGLLVSTVTTNAATIPPVLTATDGSLWILGVNSSGLLTTVSSLTIAPAAVMFSKVERLK